MLMDPVPFHADRFKISETWPDQFSLMNPFRFFQIVKHVLGSRKPVVLTEVDHWTNLLPKYLLQEFHNIPNGNFSSRFTKGYSRGFDLVMLGMTHKLRCRAADDLGGVSSALDIGCGAGSLAGVFRDHGIDDVWGIDASPYLLKLADERHPNVRFIHGLAEKLPFRVERFDACGACFVFHELPGSIADLAINEIYRVLKPGGRFVLIEPSPEQVKIRSIKKLFQLAGWKALYFRILASMVFEPFIHDWHAVEPRKRFEDAGFKVLKDEVKIPFRYLLAEKI